KAYYGNAAACGAFCLYCAEWYRRKYSRNDGWSWEAIWASLGFKFSAVELAKIIPKGMEGFWRRPVRYYDSERRNFLGSLFCEGGLPFQVLQESGSRFQMLFQKILKHHD